MLCTESGCAKSLKVSHQDMCGWKREREKPTRMSSLSDRQASTVTVSGWLGTRTVERDLPPNMRETGESAEFAYSCPCMHQQHQAQ